MEFLIDTHALYWHLQAPEELSENARTYLNLRENIPCVSYASLWEIAIKEQSGKLLLNQSFEFFIQTLYLKGIRVLIPTNEDLICYRQLPYYSDHRDPFDRFILAQAKARNLLLISCDAKFKRYPVSVIW